MDEQIAQFGKVVLRSESVSAARAGTRSYFSTWFLRSARQSAARASSFESEHDGWGPHITDVFDAVISSAISSVSFLEAMVNELLADATDQHGLTDDGYLAPLLSKAVRALAAWWAADGERQDILAKYDATLSLVGAQPLLRGEDPMQSAGLLINLRNQLVHYKPSTVYSDEQTAVARRLRGRFRAGQLHPRPDSWEWPGAVLGAGCAQWAHESAQALADALTHRMGIVPNYLRVLENASAPTAPRE